MLLAKIFSSKYSSFRAKCKTSRWDFDFYPPQPDFKWHSRASARGPPPAIFRAVPWPNPLAPLSSEDADLNLNLSRGVEQSQGAGPSMRVAFRCPPTSTLCGYAASRYLRACVSGVTAFECVTSVARLLAWLGMASARLTCANGKKYQVTVSSAGRVWPLTKCNSGCSVLQASKHS